MQVRCHDMYALLLYITFLYYTNTHHHLKTNVKNYRMKCYNTKILMF